MRFIETKKLNDYIISTGNFLGNITVEDFPQKLRALETVSLQDFSIEHDQSFLREVASVLNVIVSIIYHPHISNKHEEVIIRIELAQHTSREDFLDTVRDSKLWKEHDARMVPEEVHYHQYIDELRIYENRFICFLVDIIDKELTKFSNFYLSRLPTVNSNVMNLDRGQIGETIVEIDRLKRKTQFIKNTRFYKEVSVGKPISPKVQPTNILLKDRLYRFCFKFYRNFAKYEDINTARADLRDYYTILLFKELDRQGFELKSKEQGRYNFKNSNFALSVEPTADGALALDVEFDGIQGRNAKHIMAFNVDTERNLNELKLDENEGYDGAEMLSPWELCYTDGGIPYGITTDTEENLVCDWLNTKISKTAADRFIYKKYCPVCRTRAIDHSDDVYLCTACGSTYMFAEDGEYVTVWFRKIRKRGKA